MKTCKRNHEYEGTYCKVCQKNRAKAWIQANPEKHNENVKRWRKDNPEKHKVIAKRYTDTHKEEISKKDIEWRENNSEQHKLSCKIWRENNPDKCAAYIAKYRASILSATPDNLTEEDWKQIEDLYKKAKNLTDETGIPHEVDHIKPLQGKTIKGEHAPWNLRVITRKENRKKSNKILY